ncbi:30S ribosomal protein S13 [bacterium Unc6]|nr:30S ribosomal protein S13 [bacterium Unc6]
MPRISGVDVSKDKRIEIGLMTIYGIGRALSNRILQEAQINPGKKGKELSAEEVSRISSIIQKSYRVEGELRRETSGNIKRLMDIGSYRGTRHKKGLPVRGQRTHTNARTRKGPKRGIRLKKKTVSAGASKT